MGKMVSCLLNVSMISSLFMVLPASAAESSFTGLEGYEAPVVTGVFDRIQEHTHGSSIVEFRRADGRVVPGKW